MICTSAITGPIRLHTTSVPFSPERRSSEPARRHAVSAVRTRAQTFSGSWAYPTPKTTAVDTAALNSASAMASSKIMPQLDYTKCGQFRPWRR